MYWPDFSYFDYDIQYFQKTNIFYKSSFLDGRPFKKRMAGHSNRKKFQTFLNFFFQNFLKKSYGPKTFCKLFFRWFPTCHEQGSSREHFLRLLYRLKKLGSTKSKRVVVLSKLTPLLTNILHRECAHDLCRDPNFFSQVVLDLVHRRRAPLCVIFRL